MWIYQYHWRVIKQYEVFRLWSEAVQVSKAHNESILQVVSALGSEKL